MFYANLKALEGFNYLRFNLIYVEATCSHNFTDKFDQDHLTILSVG